MVSGVLSVALILLAFLLAAFIYQIITTPLTAVDAPTLVKAAAASLAPAPALPAGQPGVSAFPAATGRSAGPARRTSPQGASHRMRSSVAAALTIGGLAAVVFGGWLFLHVAHGAIACSSQAIEVCSQGFVLLTGTQLAGGAVALAGIISIVIAGVLALR